MRKLAVWAVIGLVKRCAQRQALDAARKNRAGRQESRTSPAIQKCKQNLDFEQEMQVRKHNVRLTHLMHLMALIAGDAGNDQIFVTGKISLTYAIAQGDIVNINGSSGTGNKGDFLSGNVGDGTLVAGADNDAMSGGGGNELVDCAIHIEVRPAGSLRATNDFEWRVAA